MPYADRDGIKLYWEWRGPESSASAKPVLLLRGLSRTLRYWMDFGGLVSDTRRTLFMDHRGIGRSTDNGKRFSIETMADDAAEVLDAAGVESANVFGISLGGATRDPAPQPRQSADPRRDHAGAKAWKTHPNHRNPQVAGRQRHAEGAFRRHDRQPDPQQASG
ncbi:MAG: alpha/beta fold hydrolase [Deltaproteobacteria bacterium]|nr:alpha/beta fold hydrolase [Deltaproteobacteria bacterium]